MIRNSQLLFRDYRSEVLGERTNLSGCRMLQSKRYIV